MDSLVFRMIREILVFYDLEVIVERSKLVEEIRIAVSDEHIKVICYRLRLPYKTGTHAMR